MEDLQSTLAVCRRTSDLMDRVERTLLPWALRSSGAEKALKAALRPLGEKAERFPSGWMDGTTAQIAVGSTIRSRVAISRFLGAMRRELGREGVALLEAIGDRPSFFSALTPRADLGEGLLKVRDYSSGEELLVYSPALGQLLQQHAESHFSFLYHNGACYQAYGIMHYFLGFEGEDFHYFARLARPQTYAASGLVGVANEIPERFAALSYFAEIPPTAHGAQRMRSFTTMRRVPSFDPSRLLADSCDLAKVRTITRCSLKDSQPPFSTAEIFHDRRDGTVVIRTSTIEAYRELARLVGEQALFPSEPELRATMNMEAAASILLGKDPPALRYAKEFDRANPRGSVPDEELAKLNGLMQEILQHANHGTPYDLLELAKRHEVSPENARAVQASLSRMEEGMQIDVPGGLVGIPELSPAEREMLARPLSKNQLFSLSAGEEALGLYRGVASRVERLASEIKGSGRVSEPSLQTLSEVLAGIDDAFWHDRHHAVLHYTLLLLCRKGGEAQKASDYAAEVLRLFWQVFLKDRTPKAIRGFAEKYEDWCRKVLVQAGLVDAEDRDAELWIAATSFFRTWISLSGYWRE